MIEINAEELRPGGEPAIIELGFHVYNVAYPGGAFTGEEQARLGTFVNALLERVKGPKCVLPFVRPGLIPEARWKSVIREHAVCWDWSTGYIYPVGEPPRPAPKAAPDKVLKSIGQMFPEQMANIEEFLKSTTMPPPELAHGLSKMAVFDRVFENRKWVSPLEVLLGTGGCVLYCVRDADRFYEDARAITGRADSPAAVGLDFQVPMFSMLAFERASAETLALWFGLFELYIAESGPGQGLLIASREDVSTMVAALESAGRNGHNPSSGG